MSPWVMLLPCANLDPRHQIKTYHEEKIACLSYKTSKVLINKDKWQRDRALINQTLIYTLFLCLRTNLWGADVIIFSGRLKCIGAKWHFPKSNAGVGGGLIGALVIDPLTPNALLFQLPHTSKISEGLLNNCSSCGRSVGQSCVRGFNLQDWRKMWLVAYSQCSTICSNTGQSF